MASHRKRPYHHLISLWDKPGGINQQWKSSMIAVKGLQRWMLMNCQWNALRSKPSDDTKICWLLSKYESTAVVNVCKGLKAVPVTVTDAQWLKFIQEISDISEEKVIMLVTFITEACHVHVLVTFLSCSRAGDVYHRSLTCSPSKISLLFWPHPSLIATIVNSGLPPATHAK